MTQSKHLQDRDYELLEFVLRYRIATRQILHRKFFDDSELNAVTKVTSRLVDLGFLARHPFIGTSSYFTLGIAGARQFGIPHRSAKALGVQSLLTQYGILEYCNVPNTNRNRFRVSELAKKHPELLQKGIDPANYVVDATSEPSKFQFVRVDGGGSSDHVLRKLRADVTLREKNPLCRALIAQGRFQLACVTYSQDKATKIESRLPAEALPCSVVTYWNPDLLSLLQS